MADDTLHRLFSYGTLRLPAVQRARFGRTLAGEPDALLGWRLEAVTITDAQVLAQSGQPVHPVLVPSADPTDRVEGVVLRLTGHELAAADAYEVADYARIEATLASGGRAWAYVAAAAR